MYNWNKVFLNYCDGGSFVGNNEVNFNGTNLHMKGNKILNAVR